MDLFSINQWIKTWFVYKLFVGWNKLKFPKLFISVYLIKFIKDYNKIYVNPYIIKSIRKNYFENIIKRYKKNFEYTKNGVLLNDLMLIPDMFKYVIMDIIDTIIPEGMGLIISSIYLYRESKQIARYIFYFAITLIIVFILSIKYVLNGSFIIFH